MTNLPEIPEIPDFDFEITSVDNLEIFGQGKAGGSSPAVAYDTLLARSQVYLQFATNDGEVDGIEEVYLNKVPHSYFSTTLDTRPGTSDQSVIAGFEDVEAPLPGFNTVQLEQDITSMLTPQLWNSPWSILNGAIPVQVTLAFDYSVTTARLTFTLNSLQRILPNGNVVGWWVGIHIYRKASSSSLQNYYEDNYKVGKASSPTPWDVYIPRPDDAIEDDNWYIILERFSPVDAIVPRNYGVPSSQLALTSVIQLFATTRNYPGTALVSLVLNDAAQFGGQVPEVVFFGKGQKIYFPNNYDPVGRTYTGFWSGSFSTYKASCNNPVWHLYDILTQRLGIPQSGIDIGQFYIVAQRCDEVVSDGKGGTEPRYSVGYQFTQRQNVQEFIATLTSLFDSNLTYNRYGQLTLSCDMPGVSVTKLITNANIIDGDFSYSSTDIESRFTYINVTFNDPVLFGQTNIITVDADTEFPDLHLVSRYGYLPLDITLTGCPSRSQAIRKGRWALWTNCVTTKFCSFKIFLEGMIYQLGELVKIWDNLNTTIVFSGRIISFSQSGTPTQTVLTLDREVILPNEPIFVNLLSIDGVTVLKKPILETSITTDTVTYVGFDVPFTGGVVLLESVSQTPPIYRVIDIQLDDEQKIYTITCFIHYEYDPTNLYDKYTYIDSPLTIPTFGADFTDVVTPAFTPINNISSLTLTPVTVTSGGTTSYNIDVNWTWTGGSNQPTSPTYTVTWTIDIGNPNSVSGLTTNSYTILNAIPGNYVVGVAASNPVNGQTSSQVMVSLAYRLVSGQSSLPGITNVYITGTSGLIFTGASCNLSWTLPDEAYSSSAILQRYRIKFATIAVPATSLLTDYVIPGTGDIGNYILTEAVNISTFGSAERSFLVYLTCEDTNNEFGPENSFTISNPQCAAPQQVNIISGSPGTISISILSNGEPDIAGYRVYISDTSGFTPSGTPAYDGPANSCILTGTSGTTYYIRCCIYDLYGTDNVNFSPEQSIIVSSVVLTDKLSVLDGLTWVADKLILLTGVATATTLSISSFIQGLLSNSDAPTVRATLGLGNSSTKDIGTTSSTVAAGNDSRFLPSLTTKGDMVVFDGAAPNKLPVGVDTYALIADSTQTLGVKWGIVNNLPSQTGNTGKYLTTDGSSLSWNDVSTGTLPTQTGNSGKFLSTNGLVPSWQTVTAAPAGSYTTSGGDSLFSSVVLGVHFDGTNNSTTFTDIKGNTLTGEGGAKLTTGNFKFGTASLVLNGNGDYITGYTGMGADLASGAITIEMWVYVTGQVDPTGNAAFIGNPLIGQSNTGASGEQFLYINTTNNLALTRASSFSDPVNFVSTGTISLTTWTHIAVVFDLINIYFYINNVLDSTFTHGTFWQNNGQPVYIGHEIVTGYPQYQGFFNGQIDDLNITKVARSSTEFNYAEPFADISIGYTTQSIQSNGNGVFYGDSNLVWDIVNNRLGVGISTPNYTVDVLGDVNVSGNFKINGVSLTLPTLDSLLPTQTGNAGKVLQTNGTTSSWQTVSGGDGGGGSGITALTGDVTASGEGSQAATLATVNSDTGTYGDSTHVPQITVNAKGLITAVSSVAVSGGSSGGSGGESTSAPIVYLPLTGTNGASIITDSQSLITASTYGSDTLISTTTSALGTGSSLYFNGDGGCLILQPNGKMCFGYNDFTISFLFNVSSSQSYGRLFQTVNGDYYTGIGVYFNPSAPSLCISLSSNGTSQDIGGGSLGSVTLNTWQQLEINRKGRNIYVMLAGNIVYTITTTSPLFFNLNDWILGGQSVGAQRSITGYMQEFLIFDYCLHTKTFSPPTTTYS